MSTHRLIFEGGAQVVRSVMTDARRRPVRVDACGFEVVDLRVNAGSTGHVLTSGAATVDSVSTTLSAAAGRGAGGDVRAVTVASAAGVRVGGRYLLVDGAKAEVVRVESISGTMLRLSSDLPYRFASGSSLLGLEVSCTIAAEVAADTAYLAETLLAVRWSPTGGEVVLEPVYLERQTPTTLATADELAAMDRGLAAMAGPADLAAAIAEASADFDVDLLSAGVSDTALVPGPIGKRAILALAAWHLLKTSTDPSAVSRAERYHARYQELRNNLLVGADKAKTARLNENNAKQAPDVRGWFAVAW